MDKLKEMKAVDILSIVTITLPILTDLGFDKNKYNQSNTKNITNEDQIIMDLDYIVKHKEKKIKDMIDI